MSSLPALGWYGGRPFFAPPPTTGERRSVPTFSIVIPAYQAADSIGEAVESALGQTVPALEVIISDDGSTDDLTGALAQYGDRVTLLRLEHRGASAARNSGAIAASGDFVTFLDADDVLLPERIEAMSEVAAARPDIDIIGTDFYIEADGRRVGRYQAFHTYEFFLRDQRTTILEEDAVPGNVAVRRALLLAVGGFDESLRSSADWELGIRLILAGGRMGLVDEPLYSYRLRAGSLSSNLVADLRTKVEILEGVLKRPDLSPEQAQAAHAALRRRQLEGVLTEVELALVKRRPDARRRALSVVGSRDFPLQTRVKAGVVVLAPRRAGHALVKRTERVGSSRLTRWVEPSGGLEAVSRPSLTPEPAGHVSPRSVRPSFSIVVVARAPADRLPDTIASALGQTMPALEVILAHPGGDVDLQGAGRDVVVQRVPEGGDGLLRDSGARMASGDFVAFLDAGDEYLPQRLEALAELACARPDLDVLTTDAYVEVGEALHGHWYGVGRRFETADQRRSVIERDFVFPHAAVCRARLLAAGGFDSALAVDAAWDCWIRLVLSGARAGLVNEALSIHRAPGAPPRSDGAASMRSAVATLEKAAASRLLTAAERRAVRRRAARYARELARLEPSGAARA